MNKKLYRSETDYVLGGVCGGLGEYLGIDPLFIRIFFIAWTILGELSVLIYFVLWLIIPRGISAAPFRVEDLGSRFRQVGLEIGSVFQAPSRQLVIYAGVGLISWGAIRLLRIAGFPWITWDYTPYLWPALLIIAGVFVLLKSAARK